MYAMQRNGDVRLNFVLEVIELYKRLPALWNIKSKEYKDKYEKEKQYNVLLNKYREKHPGADKRELTGKINLWRTNWRREHKRLVELNKNVVHEADLKTSTTWYYEPLSFLQEIDNLNTSSFTEEDYIKMEPNILISETAYWKDSIAEHIVDPNLLGLLQPLYDEKDQLTSKRIEQKKKCKVEAAVERNPAQLKQSQLKPKNKIKESPIIVVDLSVDTNSSEQQELQRVNQDLTYSEIGEDNKINSQQPIKLISEQFQAENENLIISKISKFRKRQRESPDFEPNFVDAPRLMQSPPEQKIKLWNPVAEVSDVNSSILMQSQLEECNKIAEVWATKLQKMTPQQQILAEKFVNEILFEGQMGTLHRNSLTLT